MATLIALPLLVGLSVGCSAEKRERLDCSTVGCAPAAADGTCGAPCGCCGVIDDDTDGGEDASTDATVSETECAKAMDLSNDPYTDQVCVDCVDADCGTPGCEPLPCREGKVLLRSCTDDGQCLDLDAVCARFIGPDNLCSFGDDE